MTPRLTRLLGELMIRDGSNLATGTALLKRLHFGSREILSGTNNHADGQLRCAAVTDVISCTISD